MAIRGIIRGNQGTAVVDGTWRNMSLQSHIGVGQVTRLKLTRATPYSMWAYSCPTGGMFVPSIDLYGPDSYSDYYSTSAPMDIFEFCDQTVQPDPYGLNIKNELGILVFSTNMQPLRVIRNVAGAIPNSEGTYTLFEEALPSHRRYAVLVGNQPLRLQARSDGIGIRTLKMYTPTDGNIKVTYENQMFDVQTGGYRGGLVISQQYNFQIIDVTGY